MPIFDAMNAHGRIALYGMTKKRLQSQRFTMADHYHRIGKYSQALAGRHVKDELLYRAHTKWFGQYC